MNDENRYTFGDNDRAGARLQHLAAAYEAATVQLLARCGAWKPNFAVDLGCGPGCSTRLLHRLVRPQRSLGLDKSERYVEQALRSSQPGLDFQVRDVTQVMELGARPDFLFCRFLLTHLPQPAAVLASWARLAAPGALLAIHETATLSSDHPALTRYYQLVAELQSAYGQTLEVGLGFDALVPGTGWTIMRSEVANLSQPAAVMARLHLENLRTWREDPAAKARFDPEELTALEARLVRLAEGAELAPPVRNGARQAVLSRD